MSNRKSALAASDPLRRRLTLGDMTDVMVSGGVAAAAQEHGLSVERREDGSLTIGRIVLTPRGLILPNDLTAKEWLDYADVVKDIKRLLPIIIGDLINAMKDEWEWGSKYKKASELFRIPPKTCRNLAWIMGSVQLSFRRDNLTVKHYAKAAALLPEQQEYILSLASEHRWSASTLERKIEIAKAGGDVLAKEVRSGGKEATWSQQVKDVRGYVETIAHSVETDGVVNASIVEKVEAWIAELRTRGMVK